MNDPWTKKRSVESSICSTSWRSSAEFRTGFGRLRAEFCDLRTEMHSGFDRVEGRLGHLETRVEGIETGLRAFRGEFERRVSALER